MNRIRGKSLIAGEYAYLRGLVILLLIAFLGGVLGRSAIMQIPTLVGYWQIIFAVLSALFLLPFYWGEGRRIYTELQSFDRPIHFLFLSLLFFPISEPFSRYFSYIYVGLTLLRGWRNRGQGLYDPPNAFSWASMAVVGVSVLGLLWCRDLSAGWALVQKQRFLFLLPLSLIFFRPTTEQILRLFGLLFRYCMGVMVVFVVVYMFAYVRHGDHWWDFMEISRFYFSSSPELPGYYYFCYWGASIFPPYYYFFFAMVGAMAYYARLRGVVRLRCFEFALYYLLFVLVVLLMHLRYGFWIVPMLGLTPLLIRLYDRRLPLVRWLITGGIALVGLGVFELFTRMDTFDWVRALIYKTSWERMTKALPWGYGTGYDILNPSELIGHMHSHNPMLSTMTDTGFLGLLALGLLFTTAYCTILRGRRPLLFLCFSFLLPLFVVDSPFYSSHYAHMIGLFFFLSNIPTTSTPNVYKA